MKGLPTVICKNCGTDNVRVADALSRAMLIAAGQGDSPNVQLAKEAERVLASKPTVVDARLSKRPLTWCRECNQQTELRLRRYENRISELE